MTISSEDPRSLKAAAIAATAGQWAKCWTAEGKKYGVPSQSDPARCYLVDLRSCTCPGFARRGGPCKHIAAVRLHVARVRAEQARREVVTAA